MGQSSRWKKKKRQMLLCRTGIFKEPQGKMRTIKQTKNKNIHSRKWCADELYNIKNMLLSEAGRTQHSHVSTLPPPEHSWRICTCYLCCCTQLPSFLSRETSNEEVVLYATRKGRKSAKIKRWNQMLEKGKEEHL